MEHTIENCFQLHLPKSQFIISSCHVDFYGEVRVNQFAADVLQQTLVIVTSHLDHALHLKNSKMILSKMRWKDAIARY